MRGINISAIILFMLFLPVILNAGSIEDLKQKVDYTPRIHSQQKESFTEVSIPKLIANAKNYNGKLVKIEAIFEGIHTEGLDYSHKSREYRFRRSADKYISFSIRDKKQWIWLSHLYYPKGEEKEDLLYNLYDGCRVIIYGKVINVVEDEIFIDVYDLETI